MTAKRHGAQATPRTDRLLEEPTHDPYAPRKKLPEPASCSGCSAVYQEGRWHWPAEAIEAASETKCPACRRIEDKVPAGYLFLGGEFFSKHRPEILSLATNRIEAQSKTHPMKRLMGIKDTDDGVELTFTEFHSPRDIGEAIQSAYEGDLDIQYANEGLVRVYWQR